MKLLLISGHGAGDPGAVCGSYREADETRKMTAAVAGYLEGMAEVTIYPTDRNAYEDSRKGTLHSVAGFAQYDYVLEIHFNAYKASAADGKKKGAEIYWVLDEPKARTILDSVVRLGFPDRGTKAQSLAVINAAKSKGVPAALLEVCFIDDADDMALYSKDRNAVARAIAGGIAKAFNIGKQVNKKVTYEEFKKFLEQYLTEVEKKEPAAWSEEARKWAEEKKIIQGDGEGNMKYKSDVTREELVTMLFRALNNT